MPSDPYFVLGLRSDASDEQIKAAWEQRVTAAMQGNNLRLAQTIDAAYEVLRDPVRRRNYDRTGIVVPAARPALSAPAPAEQFSAGELRQPRRRRRRRRNGRAQPVVALVLVLTSVAGLFSWFEVTGAREASLNGSTTADFNDLAGADAVPVTHLVLDSQRLLPLPAATPADGGFTTISPARWDPCRPIHYVVSGEAPVPDGRTIITSAIAELSRDTGLRFIDDGTTTERARNHRSAYQPGRYGRRWAPLLIAWTTPSDVRRLDGDALGIGGPLAVRSDGREQIVSGIAYLDTTQLAEIYTHEAHGLELVGQVVRHELGHAVGLGHTTKAAVMYPTMQRDGPFDYTAGDLNGLAWAGGGSCVGIVPGP
ncbi:MAG: matrixin family metalloprotease [Frankiales bacterium]|nr:matrixin family metalloprotease [Frankiales bacterium]